MSLLFKAGLVRNKNARVNPALDSATLRSWKELQTFQNGGGGGNVGGVGVLENASPSFSSDAWKELATFHKGDVESVSEAWKELQTFKKGDLVAVPKKKSMLSLRKKKEIIDFIAGGNKQVDATKHFSLHRSTVSSVWKNKELILKRFASRKNRDLLRCRKSPYDPLEVPLLCWIKDSQMKNVPITGRGKIHGTTTTTTTRRY